ncbi:DUF4376 domain-containing protein [Paraburkholderia sp. PREW-6R]|uniref:DUF4376 domain-containing protein n=1 Tax=Paraburkholderia sp. PREW-6R TaxID=3141544 RepID=UPI0031F503BF
MKYLYFPDTLIYAGQVDDSSVVEFCLSVAPPDNSDPDMVVCADTANNAWIVRPWTAEELAAVRSARKAILQAEYNAALTAPVSFTNAAGITSVYQADEVSQSNLLKMLMVFRPTETTPAGFFWVAADNSQVPFTYADMQGLALAIATPGIANFARLQSLKAAVDSAATLTAIQAVTW